MFVQAALSFAPQSVVMPVGSFTLVANIFFAYKFFGETLSRQDVVGTAMIVLGAVGVAVAYGVLGKIVEQDFNLDSLIGLYSNKLVWVYGAGILVLIFLFLRVIKRAERLLSTIVELEGSKEHVENNTNPLQVQKLDENFFGGEAALKKRTKQQRAQAEIRESQRLEAVFRCVLAVVRACVHGVCCCFHFVSNYFLLCAVMVG